MSGVVSLAHFDGSDLEKLDKSIETMIKRIKEVNNSLSVVSDGPFELHLVGGFIDSRHYSEDLALNLFEYVFIWFFVFKLI